MKHLKLFENQNEENVKNKILLVDASGSFVQEAIYILKNVNLYLSENFTAILFTHQIEHVFNNITINKLIKELLKNYGGGGGTDLQEPIYYIKNNNLKGPVIAITDGYFDNFDVSELENYFAILYTDDNMYYGEGDYVDFKNDLESLDKFYKPRDINYKNYEFKKITKNFNI